MLAVHVFTLQPDLDKAIHFMWCLTWSSVSLKWTYYLHSKYWQELLVTLHAALSCVLRGRTAELWCLYLKAALLSDFHGHIANPEPVSRSLCVGLDWHKVVQKLFSSNVRGTFCIENQWLCTSQKQTHFERHISAHHTQTILFCLTELTWLSASKTAKVTLLPSLLLSTLQLWLPLPFCILFSSCLLFQCSLPFQNTHGNPETNEGT